jgi:SAF domain
MTASQTLQLHPKDNVLVALNDLRKGEEIGFSGQTYTLRTDVPAKHKFAMHDISPGDDVVMYGVLIGKAIEPIGLGELLTSQPRMSALSGRYTSGRTEAPQSKFLQTSFCVRATAKRIGIHNAHRRHPKNFLWAGGGERVRALTSAAFSSMPGAEVRGFRRIFRHLCKSCDRPHVRPGRRPWRQNDPV